MSKSRDKGSEGEREVAKLFAANGCPEAVRMPLSGALPDFPGDVRLHGYCVEVKRQERWNVPAWIRQAHAAARGGLIPCVTMRRSKRGNDPCGEWHSIVPTVELARLECEVRELRVEVWRLRAALTEQAVVRRVGVMEMLAEGCPAAPADEEEA